MDRFRGYNVVSVLLRRAIISSAVGGLWTPANISTALWLDAADASTITQSLGDVSQWDDKSGNGNDVSNGAASTQPAYLATGWNGNPTVSFTATGQEFLFKASVSNFASNDDFTFASAFEFFQTTNSVDIRGCNANNQAGVCLTLPRTT